MRLMKKASINIGFFLARVKKYKKKWVKEITEDISLMWNYCIDVFSMNIFFLVI